jgi:hypothetical protein
MTEFGIMISITAIVYSKMNLTRSMFGKDSVFRNLEGIPKAGMREIHIDAQQTFSVCKWANMLFSAAATDVQN